MMPLVPGADLLVDNASTVFYTKDVSIHLLQACTEGFFMLPQTHGNQIDLEYQHQTGTGRKFKPMCIRK